MPRAMYFATALRCRPVRRAIAETVYPCLVQLQYHNQLRQTYHHHLPRLIGGEVASARTRF